MFAGGSCRILDDGEIPEVTVPRSAFVMIVNCWAGDRWIPHTKGQWRVIVVIVYIGPHWDLNVDYTVTRTCQWIFQSRSEFLDFYSRTKTTHLSVVWKLINTSSTCIILEDNISHLPGKFEMRDKINFVLHHIAGMTEFHIKRDVVVYSVFHCQNKPSRH